MPERTALVPYDSQVQDLRRRLALARHRAHDTVLELRQELVTTTDWRSWVRARPGVALSIAFLAGFLIGCRR